jgi:hypothetical protein
MGAMAHGLVAARTALVAVDPEDLKQPYLPDSWRSTLPCRALLHMSSCRVFKEKIKLENASGK